MLSNVISIFSPWYRWAVALSRYKKIFILQWTIGPGRTKFSFSLQWTREFSIIIPSIWTFFSAIIYMRSPEEPFVKIIMVICICFGSFAFISSEIYKIKK